MHRVRVRVVEDAIELVDVEYEPLPPVVDYTTARDAEHRHDLVSLEGKRRRQRRADALAASGQHRAPDGRVDRTARRIVLHEAEQQDRVLLEVVGEVLR